MSLNINPADLRYFLEVADTLNVSRAAERLGIGQPTLSQAIKRLEDEFGTRLLDRYKTGVRLTAAGGRLLVEGKSILESFAKLKGDVASAEKEIEGIYSIGCHPSVGRFALPTFFNSLLEGHPRLEIKLKHGLSREITESVVSFRTDFGIVVNPVKNPDLVIRELCRDLVGFWSAPGALSDTLIYDPSLAQSQALLAKAAQLFERKIESSNLEVIAALAESGAGAAILPERVARQHPKLKIHKRDLPVFEDRVCLVYRADRKISVAARFIIDTILKAKI
jgi:DNA-binding transcriptional LysR family regulator